MPVMVLRPFLLKSIVRGSSAGILREVCFVFVFLLFSVKEMYRLTPNTKLRPAAQNNAGSTLAVL